MAKGTIDAGTTGAVIVSSNLYTVSKLAKSSVQPGALVDPSELTGQVVVTSIGQGQQLTAANFGPATGAVSEQLNPNQRAVVIPLGTPQQVGGQIGPGSHVDVWITVSNGSRPTTQELFQNVYVLGTSGGNVTLRVTPQQAGQMIYASQNAQPWLVLRPTIATSKDLNPVTGLKAGG